MRPHVSLEMRGALAQHPKHVPFVQAQAKVRVHFKLIHHQLHTIPPTSGHFAFNLGAKLLCPTLGGVLLEYNRQPVANVGWIAHATPMYIQIRASEAA